MDPVAVLQMSSKPEVAQVAQQVLKRCLASAEVSADEYEQRKLLLDRDAGSKP